MMKVTKTLLRLMPLVLVAALIAGCAKENHRNQHPQCLV